MSAEQVAEHVRRLVAQAPPLSAAQKDKLTVLLRSEEGSSPGAHRTQEHRAPEATG